MIDLNRPVQTQAGHDVQLLNRDAGGMYPVQGVWKDDHENWLPLSWTREGHCSEGTLDRNLVNLDPSDIPIELPKEQVISNPALALLTDNPQLSELLSGNLKQWNFDVIRLDTAEILLEKLDSSPISVDIIMLDILPTCTREEIHGMLERLRGKLPTVDFLIMVDHERVDLAGEIIPLGIFDYILKPHEVVSPLTMTRFLKSSLDRLMEKRRLEGMRKTAEKHLQKAYNEMEVLVAERTAEILKVNEQLLYKSSYDHLTGLANRSLLMERLNLELSHAKRNKTMLAVFFIDLDKFKQINDTLGHDTGDWVLCQVSRRLQTVLRSSDTIARQGGDEFIVIVPDIKEKKSIELIASKIKESMSEPLNYEGQEMNLTLSMGISVFPQSGDATDLLLKNADAAMYAVKESGRNDFQFFSQTHHNKFTNRLERIENLQKALENEEFVLYYQPRINVNSGKIVGLEALVRWQPDPETIITPDEFIPFAEDTGLINPIGNWIIQKACEHYEDFRKAGFPELVLGLNISPRQITFTGLVENFQRILDESNINGHNLELEITEAVLLHEPEAAEQNLRKLKEIGILIAIDDFGTGYSSLSFLKRYPIHSLKIDRSTLSTIPGNQDNEEMVQAIVAMARIFGITVVAEGVENEEQLNLLKGWQCHEAQGYHISRPKPFKEILATLKTSKAGIL